MLTLPGPPRFESAYFTLPARVKFYFCAQERLAPTLYYQASLVCIGVDNPITPTQGKLMFWINLLDQDDLALYQLSYEDCSPTGLEPATSLFEVDNPNQSDPERKTVDRIAPA